MKNVTIYSTPTCHYCHMAKDFFKDNKIDVKGVHLIELTPDEVSSLGLEVHNGVDCEPYLEFVTKFGDGYNKIEMYPDMGTIFQFIKDFH